MENNCNWNRDRCLKWLIFLALFLFGLFCFMKEYGYCEEIEQQDYYNVPVEEECLYQYYQPQVEINYFLQKRMNYQPPTRNQKQQWQEAYDNHHFHAVRTYNDAYNRVWWLPNLTWRQLGRDAWVAACSMASTKTPTSALVVAFSTMLSQYGLHCLDEWDYIEEKLYWSKFHFDECAKYASLIHG